MEKNGSFNTMREILPGVEIQELKREDVPQTYIIESTYYLQYNSKKALYAISRMKEPYSGKDEERCFYYHVYLDLLLESVGMIINRFCPQKGASKRLEEIASYNQREYNFSEMKQLKKKCFRNFAIHIDERDDFLIEQGEYHGMFNLIYPGMDEQTKEELLDENKRQNNLLNLETFTYSIFDSGKENKKAGSFDLNIAELEKELIDLNKKSSIKLREI